MAKKNTADVLIGGKVYTISGYESTAYLQKVAAYLNEIEEQVSGMEGYRRLSAEEKQLLKNMNLADAYFNASDARDQLEKEIEQKDKEIYGLKHDLIDAEMDKEKLQKQIRDLEARLKDEEKRQNSLSQSAANRNLNRPEQKL